MRAVIALLAALIGGLATPAAADSLIPERRLVVYRDVDLPGGDLSQIFDVTLQACMMACRTNPDCTAMTYNARSSVCFPKSDAGTPTPYEGAFSAQVLTPAPGAEARAEARAAAAPFLSPSALSDATRRALDLSGAHPLADGQDLTTLLAQARKAEQSGNLGRARQLTSSATLLSDTSGQWLAYARLLRAGNGTTIGPDQPAARAAALNAYLRAESDDTAAEALALAAQVYEYENNGPVALKALRLAADLSDREDLRKARDIAAGKYGFRVIAHKVEQPATGPQLCAQFSEPLSPATDYTPFVSGVAQGLAIETRDRQLCISGLDYGARSTLTLRAGLPAASGDTLARPVEITQYIRDRDPQVRFSGRAYILPRAADAGLPVLSVNADRLDLVLWRISDRNLVRTLRDGYMARPLDRWDTRYLRREMAETVWEGHTDITPDLNNEVTTRLPVQDLTGPLGAGIYALQARVTGSDDSEIAPATQWFTVSDLGISALGGADGLVAVLRGLSDAGPREGAELRLISRGNAVLGSVRTDENGVARFPAGLTEGRGNAAPAALVAELGDDMTFLPLTDPEFDLSDRGVEGAPPAPPVDVFLTTDRGAYRAGEQINATVLARAGSDQRALPGLPLTAVLRRPDGVEFARQIAPETGAGGHLAGFALPLTAPRGTWRLEVFADTDAAPLASTRLLVEDFLPERIDFTPEMPDTILAPGDEAEIRLNARYLFGAPAAGLETGGELRLRAADSLPGHEGYQFGRSDARFDPQAMALPVIQTDAEGAALIRATLPRPDATITRPFTADLIVTLREGSGRAVERRLSRTVLPPAPVIGIRPLFEDGAVGIGEEARFAVIALAPDGQQTALRADWAVNRIETDYQWYALNGRWDYERITRRIPVASGQVDLAANAPAELAMPVDWGRYELVVTPQGGTGTGALGFDAGWYTTSGQLQTPDRLAVSLDRAEYRSGDEARIRVEAPAAGVGVVSVLSNRVVDLKIVDLKAGENELTLPITEDWGSGAYVTVSALRGLAQDQGRAPVRALGLAYAKIAPGDRALSTRIEAPETADPRGALPVTLHVDRGDQAPGGPVYASLAAVDLGVLNLTGFDAPDPQAHYFGQRRLGVALRDVYGRLIDGHAGVAGLLRSGGDALAGMSVQSPPPTEDLLSWFSGPLEVGPDGTLRVDIPLPAFNGTVRLMVLTWSAEGVGQASTDVLVRDPIVLAASAPRFLAPGDQAELGLELTHVTGPAGPVALSVSATGIQPGALPDEVTLSEGGAARLSLPITAPEQPGIGEITLAMTTPGGAKLTKVLTLPVVANGPETSHQSRFTLAAGDDLTLPADLLAGFQPGAQAMLTVGPAARFDAGALLPGLARYPYGCTEQVTSKALPLLVWGEAAEGLPGAELAATRIDQAIEVILTRQAPDGGFGLWRPESGDGWLDAYVTDFLSRARAAGHAVPDAAFRMALDNLRNQVNYAPDFDAGSNGGGTALAYQLMVLARESAAAVGDLRYYADQKAGDFATPIAQAQLGAALASYGDQPRADALFTRAARSLTADAPEDYHLRADYGTRLRDRAAVLALASAAGSTALDQGDLGNSLAQSLHGQALSPQEAVWTLMAAGALNAQVGDGFTLNGAPLAGTVIRDVTGAGGALLHNGSNREEQVTLTLTGQPRTPEPAGGKGYSISRAYFTPDGTEVDPAEIAQGTRLVAVLTVTPHQPGGGRLMVDDPLPAGFEIDNPHLLQSGDLSGLAWLEPADAEASEFRADRFLAAVDWSREAPFRLAYQLRAITPGRFAHPAASVVDMYRPTWRGWSDSGVVQVTP